jgi:phage terminase large subunit GpA-like protein
LARGQWKGRAYTYCEHCGDVVWLRLDDSGEPARESSTPAGGGAQAGL